MWGHLPDLHGHFPGHFNQVPIGLSWNNRPTRRTGLLSLGPRQTKRAKENNTLDSTKRYVTCYPFPDLVTSRAQAFAPKSGRRADRQGRRNVERDQTRLHVPLVDRTPDDTPPPVIIAIVGPPGVGKTTLLKSLVRRYSKQTMQDAKGPITVVGGKKRRLTFIECNNDLNSMIDIAKVVDLVLLMIDGSFGFEMVRSLRITDSLRS